MYAAFDTHLSTARGTGSAVMPFKVRGRIQTDVALAERRVR